MPRILSLGSFSVEKPNFEWGCLQYVSVLPKQPALSHLSRIFANLSNSNIELFKLKQKNWLVSYINFKIMRKNYKRIKVH